MKGPCERMRFTSGGSFVECTAFQCSQCPKKKNIGVITKRCFKVEKFEQTKA